ncbi:MAG TPA: TonB-dependent receptor [Acidobacteriota bacterium]|nr:TonB-dependent receptor [Acidobacteriota bacterium]
MKFVWTGLLAAALTTVLAVASPALDERKEQEKASSEERKPQEEPPPLQETIVVTASGQREELADSVSLVTRFDRQDLMDAAGLTLDDKLRRVPGFSLFRRSSSLIAHPTTQGVSLRGIGPSGASRSLVMLDGIPLNDPFGGWVYWNRLPTLALEAVEVARGGGSQLYGSSALGGTLQLLTRSPGETFLEGEIEGGRFQSFNGQAAAGGGGGDLSYLVAGRFFDSQGFFVVPEKQRGRIDRPLDLAFQSFLGRLTYKDLHATVNLYHEDRGNGTPLQRNGSRFQLFQAGLQRPNWRWSFHLQSGRFDNRFSRLSPDRNSEVQTAVQRFDTLALGSSISATLSGRLLIGADWRRVEWDGRAQNLAGLFLQDVRTLHPRLDLLLGLRLDAWENNSTQGEANPRAGLVWRAAHSLTVRTSLYRGFRAPTLNELHRPFQVGNAFTLANPELASESLWGYEAGFDLHPGRHLLLRFNAFATSLRDPVGNVTLSSGPDGILRRRQNLGPVDIRGWEFEGRHRRGAWEMRAAYLYSFSQVESSGLRLPQAPLHQASLGLFRQTPAWKGGIEVRYLSSQFNDDLNSVRLGGYALVDLSASLPLGESWEMFAAAENLLDRRYAFDATPLERLGTPRLVHGGLRWRLQ